MENNKLVDDSSERIRTMELEKAVEEKTRELAQANRELSFQNKEREKRAVELMVANEELVFQNDEKAKRAAELILANVELVFQNKEKGKRADELVIANEALALQNTDKEKLASELIIANAELVFQNHEKEKRAAELQVMNTELEAFSFISSHDLQEPLRKITIYCDRISISENGNLSEAGKEYFRRIQASAVRMRELIQDLLHFSTLTLTERKFEDTDLATIVAEVISELKEAIEEKEAWIESTGLCHANIIPFQFRQVMHNLIGNALKFSRPGYPPHIIIKSKVVKGLELADERLIPEKKYCHVSVTDNGIGFDPENKDRIFEVFQRLHKRDQYTGTGIGLAIVKKVMDNHYGIISATSKLNEGTTFDIYIPMIQ